MSDLRVFALGRTAWAALAFLTASGAFVATNIAHDKHTRAEAARTMTGGDPGRALPLFRRYGCSGCHTISGVPGADGQVGPALTSLSHRVYVAGVIVNRPNNLIAWIVSPQIFSPQTAMPQTGISDQEARDLAAYLYAQ
jgi:cytochrome c